MTLAERVTLWHLETFPNATAQDIADKALEEVLELNSAHGDQEVAEEMADVYLCILALAGRGKRLLLESIGFAPCFQSFIDSNVVEFFQNRSQHA